MALRAILALAGVPALLGGCGPIGTGMLGPSGLLGCYALRFSGDALGTYDGPQPARVELTVRSASSTSASPKGLYAAEVGFWDFTGDSVAADTEVTPTWSQVLPDSIQVNFGWERGLVMRARVAKDTLDGSAGTMGPEGFHGVFHVTGLRDRCRAAAHTDPRFFEPSPPNPRQQRPGTAASRPADGGGLDWNQ